VAGTRIRTLAAIGLLLASGTGHAAPIVSLDLDPLQAGVQATLAVPLAGAIQVDVVVLGIDTPPLAAFEFDLGFDPGILTLGTVTNGGFLNDPFFFDVFPGAAGVRVEAAIRSFGGGPTGDGVLASLTFDTLGPGTSLLDLEIVLLRPLGAIFPDPTIPTDAVNDGVITIVPEPSSAALLGLGCTVAAIARRLRR